MKKNLLIISFLIVAFAMQGQEFRFGFNLANMTLGNSTYESSASLLRPELGITTESMELSNNLNFHFEYLLSWKGMNYRYYRRINNTITNDYIVETQYKVRLTYLEMPFIFEMPVGPLDVEFGPSLAIRLGGGRKGQTTITYDYDTLVDTRVTISETGRYSNNEIFPKGVDAASPISFGDLAFNLGASYPINDEIKVYARYYYGLTDVMRRNYPVKNASLTRQAHNVFKIGATFLL